MTPAVHTLHKGIKNAIHVLENEVDRYEFVLMYGLSDVDLEESLDSLEQAWKDLATLIHTLIHTLP